VLPAVKSLTGSAAPPSDLAFAHCDIRDEAAVAGLLADAGTRWGRLDVLVNDAGVLRPGPFERVTRAGWAETMAVNAEAPFFLAQAAATRFATLRAVVNLASTPAFVAGSEQSVTKPRRRRS
jgi:NAD(P)-dependent dehydrogenase (short-subunit alcohol dehydrogenase family)